MLILKVSLVARDDERVGPKSENKLDSDARLLVGLTEPEMLSIAIRGRISKFRLIPGPRRAHQLKAFRVELADCSITILSPHAPL